MAARPGTAATLELRDVTKRYVADAPPAVDALSLTVSAGEVCVLIGPSGCGKTTALRMINRLVEPTSGQLIIDGQEVHGLDPPQLRRRIGYVIQQVGLLPHLTIAANVSTVPHLLGWERPRIATRVAQMLDLVGLPPATYAHRYPVELSGGQQQRVGLARALAADPPLMLMDEPFSAVDPITRERLQRDFLALQREVAKTVVFVTHDIDEAVRMGDRIAILREGRLVQVATPTELLTRPADAFVSDFVGADRALKALALRRVRDLAARPLDGVRGPVVSPDVSLRDALSKLLETGAAAVLVAGADGAPVGSVTLADLLAPPNGTRRDA